MPSPRKASKKSTGAPTWMVTFGDLMSLLFSLFVLLFTYSTVDAEKYKALAGSLKQAFGSSRNNALIGDLGGPMAIINLSPEFAEESNDDPSQKVVIELEPPHTETEELEKVPTIAPPAEVSEPAEISEKEALETAKIAKEHRTEELERQLNGTISEELAGARIEVERKGDRVLIRFPNEIAFSPGSAETNARFESVLTSLTNILSSTPGEIIVGGHTDNVPITPGGRYQSNWELSAGRAAAVVHILLKDNSMSPGRVTIQGFGDSRPRVDNDSEENRAKNRRVVISILTDSDIKKGEQE